MFSFFENIISAVQWFFSFIGSIFTSLYNLLSFVGTFLTFAGTVVTEVVPEWLLPFFVAIIAYCIIMFIIHFGGK